MKRVLTPGLLSFLEKQGYKYLLFKSYRAGDKSSKTTVSLTPVVQKPLLQSLPDLYDTWFEIDKVPVDMAFGIDSSEYLIELTKEDSMVYIFSQHTV